MRVARGYGLSVWCERSPMHCAELNTPTFWTFLREFSPIELRSD